MAKKQAEPMQLWGGPPGPALRPYRYKHLQLPREADEGVDRGPGGPSHNLSRIPSSM